MFRVSPGLTMCRQKQKWNTREDENTPSTHVALFLCRVRSQAQLSLEVTSGAEKFWSRPLTVVMMNSNEVALGLVPSGFLISLNCLDHFPNEPAITPVRATGHQLVTLCRSIRAEERAQTFDPLMGSKYFTMYFITFVAFFSSLYSPVHRIRCRSSTFGTKCCTFRSTCCWQKWHERKRVRDRPSQSSCAVKSHVQNEKDVGGRWSGSVLCHWGYRCSWQTEPLLLSHLPQGRFDGPHEALGHFQRAKHFARDQQLETGDIGWRVLDFEGKPVSENELERQRERILPDSLVIRDPEYPFADDQIADKSGAPDVTLPVLAKVLSLIAVLRLGGPYELFYQLWSQFTLIASRMNIEAAWCCNEVLVGILLFHVSTYPCSLAYRCCVFSRSFWTGCTLATFLGCSGGWRRMDKAALSLKSAAQRFGWWCGHGRGPLFVVFVLLCWAASAPILPWRLRFWPKF